MTHFSLCPLSWQLTHEWCKESVHSVKLWLVSAVVSHFSYLLSPCIFTSIETLSRFLTLDLAEGSGGQNFVKAQHYGHSETEHDSNVK
jgi:hypothetical protein